MVFFLMNNRIQTSFIDWNLIFKRELLIIPSEFRLTSTVYIDRRLFDFLRAASDLLRDSGLVCFLGLVGSDVVVVWVGLVG